MRFSIVATSLIALLSAPCWVSATTWDVCPDGSGDFTSIQTAIDDPSVVGGDIIQLCQDTFSGDGNRDIDYKGKVITVHGDPDHPDLYVIDCGGSPSDYHGGFEFHSGEGPGSVLEGVTITNDYGFHDTGINCYSSSSPTIRACILPGNIATVGCYGGGICCRGGSSATISNCIISYNSADDSGGGIRCLYSSPEITDCIISWNTAVADGGLQVQ